MTELVLGQGQAGQEGAECDRQAEQATARREADREHQRREQ